MQHFAGKHSLNDFQLFRDDCERIRQIVKQYRGKCDEYWNTVERKVVREEYAPFSIMHRGTYCPSLIEDIVISNVRRKEIYKRITKKTKPSFRYGFDENNRLILVDDCDKSITDHKEFILYSGNYELGISYKPEEDITEICECYFENKRLKKYALYLTDITEKKINVQIDTMEKYTYFNEKLEVEHLSFLDNLCCPIWTHKKYTFDLNNGYIESYICENYSGDILKRWSGGEERIKVNIERKI